MDLTDAYGAWGRPALVAPAQPTPPMYDEAAVAQIVERAARGAVQNAMDRMRTMVAQEVRMQGVQIGAATVSSPPPSYSPAPRMDMDKMWLAGINIALILVLGVLGSLIVVRSPPSSAFMYPPFHP